MGKEIAMWEVLASLKREATLAKIDKEWVLPDHVIKDAASRRNITGSFIEALLSPRERTLTGLTSPVLVEGIRDRLFTATEVTIAFCKRAAFAHQLVSSSPR